MSRLFVALVTGCNFTTLTLSPPGVLEHPELSCRRGDVHNFRVENQLLATLRPNGTNMRRYEYGRNSCRPLDWSIAHHGHRGTKCLRAAHGSLSTPHRSDRCDLCHVRHRAHRSWHRRHRQCHPLCVLGTSGSPMGWRCVPVALRSSLFARSGECFVQGCCFPQMRKNLHREPSFRPRWRSPSSTRMSI